MEKHPFFMTKAPEAGEPLSPLMEGLQQLKYSETDNTPQGTAMRPIKKNIFTQSNENTIITFPLDTCQSTEVCVQICEKKSRSEWELIDFGLTSRLKSELTYLEVILLMYGCHISRNIKSTGAVVVVDLLSHHNLFSGIGILNIPIMWT